MFGLFRRKSLARDAGRRDSATTTARVLAVVVGVFALWELLAWLGAVDERTASRPSLVIVALAGMVAGGDAGVYRALADTAYALLMAFLIGAGVGLLIGIALAMSATIREAYLPIVLYLLGIPKTIFLPLFILIFGLGHRSAIAFGAVLALLQVAVNVLAGIDSIDKRYFRVAGAFNASPTSRFWHVIVPGAAPGIFAGLWHGIRNAFVGVLIAQMFVSNVGIGYLVKTYTNRLRVDEAMALILVSAVFVIGVGMLWNLAESRLTAWNKQPRT